MKIDWKSYFGASLLKKLGAVMYEDVIYKIAEDIVKDSATPWDDAFLSQLDKFVREELLSNE